MITAKQSAGIVIKDAGPFRVLYELPGSINLVICIGGRGGRKSYEVSKFCTKSATIDKKRIAVLRDEKEKIRESILNEIFNRYDTANQYGHFNPLYDKIESGIRDKQSNEMLVFTQGFRASSKEKQSNLKGVSGVDIAIIEEAEDIRSFQKFNTFKDSMRKEGRLIIVMLNTPDINHWIVKVYFNLEPVYLQLTKGML
jgi:phage terminase large subunit